MNLVIGKFYPPHEGHHWLIDQALADGPTIVAIMWSEQESIRPGLRKKWLQDVHGYLCYIIVKDELPVDFNDQALSNRHADLIQRELLAPHLGLNKITKVFGCEPYVEHLAEYFWARPVRLDRSHIPISATQIREDPRQYWDYLRPATKAGLCKRIVCIGAESCGTTTLAKDLAEHYQTVWVPEYGRLYSEGLTTGAWHHEDLCHIASAQHSLEEALARRSEHGLLISDTDMLATQVWDMFLTGGPMRIKPFNHPSPICVHGRMTVRGSWSADAPTCRWNS